MDEREFREDQERLLLEAAQFFLNRAAPKAKLRVRDLPLVAFWLKALYVAAVGIGLWVITYTSPTWVKPFTFALVIGWSVWVLWSARSSPCVICSQPTKNIVPSFAYRDRAFWDIRPVPRHMYVFVCKEHEQQILLTHLMQQVRRPEGL